MRVTINGSGAILTHGDSLSGGGVIEFPINEPPEFAATLSAYTVTDSAPSRKLKYQGHEIAVEAPTASAERAGTTQQVSLVGPFRVNYNDPGIGGDPGVAVTTLDEGTLVLKAWLVVITRFIADGTDSGHSAYVNLGVDAGTLTNYDTNFGSPGSVPAIVGQEAQSDTAITHTSQFVAAGGQPLTVAVYPGSGSFTAGAVDCYAVIAIPAAS
jgi:hypothetical protein